MLKEAVESKPDNPDAFDNLGLSYFEMRYYDEAKNAFLKSINLVQDKVDKSNDPSLAETASTYY